MEHERILKTFISFQTEEGWGATVGSKEESEMDDAAWKRRFILYVAFLCTGVFKCLNFLSKLHRVQDF